MFEKEYGCAIEAAKKAGAIIAHYFDRPYTVHEKGNDQPVTIADHEANRIIQSTLFSLFPNDGWLSEETQDNPERLKKERVWIVDPLDGTKEFISKIPEFGVSIGLVLNGQPIIGVVYNPITGELFTARKGEGTFLNRQPVKVSSNRQLDTASLLASRSEIARGEWSPYKGKFLIHPSGGIAYKMSLVASGTADGSFSLQPKNEWDFCAGTLMIQEAGGKVLNLDGSPFTFNKENPKINSIIYGNSHICRKLVDFLGDKE